MMDEEQKMTLPLQVTPVSGKYYEWQLSFDQQWLKIDNDHVIETHYRHPGAKEISINTSRGKVFIDFDTLQTNNAGMKVQRLSLLPQGQSEDIGWYFRDDQLWREYGYEDSSKLFLLISSSDVEQQYNRNPQGTFTFTVDNASYTLDFSTMIQKNDKTGWQRKVRRRPKLESNSRALSSTSTPPAASSQGNAVAYKWEFKGDGEQWTEYQAHVCSFDSAAIERHFQLNKQGVLQFNINDYSYTLDFSSMQQVNDYFRTKRDVRRTPTSGIQQKSGSGTQVRWQFLDVNGVWTDYSKKTCSTSSQEIEFHYLLNPSGTTNFTTSKFNYELSFTAMTQENLRTGKTRKIRRLNQ